MLDKCESDLRPIYFSNKALFRSGRELGRRLDWLNSPVFKTLHIQMDIMILVLLFFNLITHHDQAKIRIRKFQFS